MFAVHPIPPIQVQDNASAIIVGSLVDCYQEINYHAIRLVQLTQFSTKVLAFALEGSANKLKTTYSPANVMKRASSPKNIK